MSRILLDTNVVSELTKEKPDERVITFLNREPDLWVSTIVLHELEFGLRLLPSGWRHRRLRAALSKFVTEYRGRFLALERREAEQAAVLRADAQRAGRTVHLADALIAGTAKAHDLVVATRNVPDFDGMDVDIINPWEAPTDWGEEVDGVPADREPEPPA